MAASPSKPSNLSDLPSVDQILRTQAAAGLRESMGVRSLTALARTVIEEIRTELKTSGSTVSKETLLQQAGEQLLTVARRQQLSGLKRVINATGVILHTNLGRAPLSDAARRVIADDASSYCTIEYDLQTGTRGRRGARVEELLIELTGAEAALVINNCASAALLVLSVLARNGETIVSRGELVEIGGDFRVPEVMATSGTRMVEVGTTNRTTLADYRGAINEQTRLIMKVHPSNYRVIGFTTAPSLSDLTSTAHETGLLLYEDAGSGVVNDLSRFGLNGEPLIRESIAAGADVVSFSGDKLLGASQAGLLVGRREIIERLRKHPLYRALRADKLCLAVLEVTLDSHRREAFDEIPVFKMLSLSPEEINRRASELVSRLGNSPLSIDLVPGESAVGGGSGPDVHPATTLIALQHAELTPGQIEHLLRFHSLPVIARVADNRVLIDLRTVDPAEETELLDALRSIDK